MTLITDSASLKEIYKEIKKEDYITVDTEFLRDKYYYPKLCLVQIATSNNCYAIDPLAEGIDLTPLKKILLNKSILKVFHAARQDIEVFINMFEKVPVPVFDTQVAGMVCGFGAAVSYGNLVKDFTGVNLDKSSRFTDWSKRPLSSKQIEYALSDVSYLRNVYEGLVKKLKENKRESWMKEEMASLVDPKNYQVDLENFWERLKPKTNSRRFIATVSEIIKWRESQAIKENKPRSFILKDQAILQIAAVMPVDVKDLKKVRDGGRGISVYADDILKAVEVARGLPENKLPYVEKQNYNRQVNKALLEMLKVLLRVKSNEIGVAEKIITNADELQIFASQKKSGFKLIKGWRHEVFWKHAEALRDGKIAIALDSDKIKLINI